MRTKLLITMILVALAPLRSLSQTLFEGLYDCDSTQDWGWNVFVKPDNNYLIIGGVYRGRSQLMSMHVSSDGSNANNIRKFSYGAASIFPGNAGSARRLSNGDYLVPISIQSYGPSRSTAGLCRLNAAGDTIFVRTYTDTSIFYELGYACAELPNGDLLMGGSHKLNGQSIDSALIVRTDALGNMIWVHNYRKISNQSAAVNSVESIDNDRILVGAASTTVVSTPQGNLHYNAPWFLVLDNTGNKLRDTLYGNYYCGTGAIYKDINGGYYHYGATDSLPNNDIVNGLENFPAYISHLDTNFNIEWIVKFPYSDLFGQRRWEVAKQMHDGSYILVGEVRTYSLVVTQAWVAKISSNGQLIWNHQFYRHNQYAYLRDVVEKADGGLVVSGGCFSDTTPSWHYVQDVWLLGLDSNGCIVPGCDNGLGVEQVSANYDEQLMIYPNPSSGDVHAYCPEHGSMSIYNMQGQQVGSYMMKQGENNMRMPGGISTGVYLCRFVPAQGDKVPTVIRLVYEP